jgi:signal transduction histidine kinase
MVLPVMYAGAVIGQIGIANGSKYSDDVTSQVEILTLMISNVIQTRRSQREKEELIRKEELIKARDLFMANISHEIRTPLNSVIGMLALLQDSQLSEVQIEYVDIARRSSYSLLSLINDILDITKLEANKMSLNYKVVNIRDIIERSIDVVLSATVKRIPIRTIISEQVPLHVDTDGERIRQMLINLLNNAVKFTEDGQIVIRIEPATPEDVAGLDLPPIAEHTPPAPSLRVVGGSRRLSGGDEPVRLFTRPDRALAPPTTCPAPCRPATLSLVCRILGSG